jgi:DNA-binding CsgD family transcriptional regulator
VPIALSDDERGQLQTWARRRTGAGGSAARSKIVLAAADGSATSNTEIAARLGVSRSMVTT